jgi:actin-related protein
MEKTDQANAAKHEKLNEGEKGVTNEIELIKNKYTKNLASPFINHVKNWDDEEYFHIPEVI